MSLHAPRQAQTSVPGLGLEYRQSRPSHRLSWQPQQALELEPEVAAEARVRQQEQLHQETTPHIRHSVEHTEAGRVLLGQ